MGKNKTKNKSRKKASQKRKRRRKHEKLFESKKEREQPSRRPTPLTKAPPTPDSEHRLLKYVPSYLPCEDGDNPDHHLTCPYFDLDVGPLPDNIVTKDTRITSTFKDLMLKGVSPVQSDLDENEKMVCAFHLVNSTETDAWFRCLLPFEHEVLSEWRLKVENYALSLLECLEDDEKELPQIEPVGPLRLYGTIVGIDEYGVQLSSGRIPKTDLAFVLQDVTLERAPQHNAPQKSALRRLPNQVG